MKEYAGFYPWKEKRGKESLGFVLETVLEEKRLLNLAVGAGFLLPCVVWDIRTRMIPGWYLGTGMLLSFAGGCAAVALGLRDVPETLLAILPGMFLIILAYFTEEKIGLGDGICFLILGILEGCLMCIVILMISLLLSGLYSCVLLLFLRRKGRERIPFLPFVLGAVLIRAVSLLI